MVKSEVEARRAVFTALGDRDLPPWALESLCWGMHDDWLPRWREGRIGFHEGRPNDLLVHHAARLADCRRVLVPLCGKAEDLVFLAARGHDVVGIELAPSIARRGPFVTYEIGPGNVAAEPSAGPAGAITLLSGDFFAVSPELLGPVDALYDRAALVALPPELRPPYVARLRALVPAGAPALVITYEYDQAAVGGPPFSVLEDELRALYAGAVVELLEERPGGLAKCAQSGVPVSERCFATRLPGPRP
jgi:thiopurine S-methyltransferase